MAFSRGLATPGLDWVATAGEGELLDFLGREVPCPRCGGTLRQDPLWSRPNLADEQGHTFSNVRALVMELYQRGLLGPSEPSHRRTGRRETPRPE